MSNAEIPSPERFVYFLLVLYKNPSEGAAKAPAALPAEPEPQPTAEESVPPIGAGREKSKRKSEEKPDGGKKKKKSKKDK